MLLTVGTTLADTHEGSGGMDLLSLVTNSLQLFLNPEVLVFIFILEDVVSFSGGWSVGEFSRDAALPDIFFCIIKTIF